MDLPTIGMENFLINRYQNPSYQSGEQVCIFICHRNIPITDDGCFLAYKAIKSNWMDKYSGTFRNMPGDVVSMDRRLVDDDRQQFCSVGLHVGALDYVYQYADGDDRIVIVKVNPKDAVSVPTDELCQKLRVCRYEVVSEYKGELQKPVYTNAYEDEDDWMEDEEDPFDNEDEDDNDYDEEEDDRFDPADVTSCPADCGCKEPVNQCNAQPTNGKRYFMSRANPGLVWVWNENTQTSFWLNNKGEQEPSCFNIGMYDKSLEISEADANQILNKG